MKIRRLDEKLYDVYRYNLSTEEAKLVKSGFKSYNEADAWADDQDEEEHIEYDVVPSDKTWHEWAYPEV